MRRLVDSSLLKWFYPGMHIKRWLLLLMVGVAIFGLGMSYFAREIYLTYTFPSFVYYLTLQFIPRYGRGILFIMVSFGVVLFAIWKLSQSLLMALLPSGHDESLVNIIYNHRFLKRGPKVVAIGGGTGLSTLLRGLKEYTGNLTAIVTVADDGGSSGRLRRELGILPPGDVRNCIAALADAEPLMTRLFQYRFSEGSGLEGHSFGNLFIVAMTGVTGNFEEAIRQTSRVLLVRGQIMPSTLANVTLVAESAEGDTIYGESSITERGSRIKRVYLQPQNVQAYPDAIRAILTADMIVVGPGSLYTSVLPNLLVDGVRRALIASPALKVYVCNVATQKGETDSFTVSDHLRVLEEHVGQNVFHCVVANSNVSWAEASDAAYRPVIADAERLTNHVQLLLADVVSDTNHYHHDSKKLAATLFRRYYERDQWERIAAAVVQQEAARTG